jgi:hypothetical protein
MAGSSGAPGGSPDAIAAQLPGATEREPAAPPAWGLQPQCLQAASDRGRPASEPCRLPPPSTPAGEKLAAACAALARAGAEAESLRQRNASLAADLFRWAPQRLGTPGHLSGPGAVRPLGAPQHRLRCRAGSSGAPMRESKADPSAPPLPPSHPTQAHRRPQGSSRSGGALSSGRCWRRRRRRRRRRQLCGRGGGARGSRDARGARGGRGGGTAAAAAAPAVQARGRAPWRPCGARPAPHAAACPGYMHSPLH